MKPTCRLVPQTGLLSAFPLTFYDWNCIGPMARYVEDLEFVLRIVAGPDGADPYVAPVPLGKAGDVRIAGLRVALCPDDGSTKPTPETTAAVGKAAQALREAGANVVEHRPPMMDQVQDIWLYNAIPLWTSAARHYPRNYAKLMGVKVADPRHFSTEFLVKWLELWQREKDFGNDRQVEFLATLQQFREAMIQFMDKYDAILSPVANKPAAPHPDPKAPPEQATAAQAWASFKAESGGFCQAHNLTGWPAAVVRAGTSPEGLPIGVQVAAKPWREDVALAVAGVIEDKLGGWKPPSL